VQFWGWIWIQINRWQQNTRFPGDWLGDQTILRRVVHTTKSVALVADMVTTQILPNFCVHSNSNMKPLLFDSSNAAEVEEAASHRNEESALKLNSQLLLPVVVLVFNCGRNCNCVVQRLHSQNFFVKLCCYCYSSGIIVQINLRVTSNLRVEWLDCACVCAWVKDPSLGCLPLYFLNDQQP